MKYSTEHKYPRNSPRRWKLLGALPTEGARGPSEYFQQKEHGDSPGALPAERVQGLAATTFLQI